MARTAEPWYWVARDGWYVTIRGERHMLAKGRKAKAKALEVFHRLMVREGQPTRTAPLSVAKVCDLFLADVHRRQAGGELVASTIDWYGRHLQSFAEHAGRLATNELRPFHVTGWLAAHEWSQGNRHGAATAVKAAFRWASRQGYLDADPLAGLKRPGAERREVVMTTDQVRAILDATEDEPWRDLLTVLWETGARPGEIAKVTAAELDLARDRIVFPPRRSKTGRKTGRPRVIYLSGTAKAIVIRWAARFPEGPVFRNLRGNPWTRNAMACRFARIRKRFGFGGEATAYSLRHQFATAALEASVSIATVSELLGHRDTTMISRVYSHLAERHEHLKDAIDKVRPDAPPSDDPV